MVLEQIKYQSFPPKPIKDWHAKAEEALKGKTIETLSRSTYENIILKPLYTRRDEQPVPDYSGDVDFRRGIYPLGYITNEWKLAQRISYQTPEDLKKKLLEAFKKGQTAVSFELSQELFNAGDGLSGVLEELVIQFPLAINANGWHKAFFDTLKKVSVTSNLISGYMGSDPIAHFAVEGYVSENYFCDWLKHIDQVNKTFTNLRTILINTVPYHNSGASAVQELGIAIAEGVCFLEKLLAGGIGLEDALSNMVFNFSIGSNFFMEMSKLRAARVLWNRITELYGAKVEMRGMVIAAETSTFTKTVHDPHVNLLRAGNEAFAAVLGGIQYLHVAPFDSLTGSTPFSERIARNIQLLLKEEAQLKKVIDPAGGSWYVEKLTSQLAERAWEFFQQIEARGGILEVLKSGWLQTEVQVIYEKRKLDILRRKQKIVGTNAYANLAEEVPDNLVKDQKPSKNINEDSILQIKAFPTRRLAEPFEDLRRRAKQLQEKTGSIPSIGVICLGQIKHHKPRTDFIKGFFAAGGLNAIESISIVSLEDAKLFILEQPVKYFCFCGSNDQYELMGHDLLKSLKTEFPERIFYLAGLPEEEMQALWQNEGIQEFIHMKTNCFETLTTILDDMEVSTVEETKA